MPDRVIPPTYPDFAEYNRRMWDSPTLAVGAPALSMREFLFATPHLAQRPLFRWVERMTSGLMPPRLRAPATTFRGPGRTASC
ncbi:MAG: hypothetical protein R3B70_03645 [Polyangiaceae bacterium]